MEEEKSAASVRMLDWVTAAVFFAIGIVVIIDSVRLGWKWGSDGPEPGYFPFYIGLIICIASVVNALLAFRVSSRKSFVSVPALKTILSVLVPTTIYVALIAGIGPVPGTGIYVASAIFIAMFMKWLGKFPWGMTIGVSIAVPVAFFLLFEIWFKVPLPKGPLEAAMGFA